MCGVQHYISELIQNEHQQNYTSDFTITFFPKITNPEDLRDHCEDLHDFLVATLSPAKWEVHQKAHDDGSSEEHEEQHMT